MRLSTEENGALARVNHPHAFFLLENSLGQQHSGFLICLFWDLSMKQQVSPVYVHIPQQAQTVKTKSELTLQSIPKLYCLLILSLTQQEG
ncbi:hypothetical protein CMV_028044 [Castanea mollissima]|uniref:Uncharacterized protein n=1 Tax=Castanea mollissima TaxID=60419 RepID=A0A8J4VEN5_9ROSI|nr:hypothetical protein CMV_028044 [Castanea mollissima]